MYLKKIEVRGFKSFSDKVVISFDRGLNVITGPNGSGKCIVGEQKILLSEREETVKNLFDEIYKKRRNVLLSTNKANYLIPLEAISVPSLERGCNKLVFNRLLAIMKKRYEGVIFELIGENGTSIKVTPEHRILSEQGWESARDLNIGMKILSFGELKADWEKIYEIKLEKYMGEVYDVYLSNWHNYLIGKYGIVVHNSNLIDAIKFVLGENNARLLRVDKMANLISDNIREKETRVYGRIYLDNSDEKIPLDEKEVVISRYLDKNGDSIYYVNRKRATKVAVQNLLSMAGLYVRGYNIVMQGEISRMSERTPEEIRKIVEESVGLASYDEKKAEAEEELKEAEVNLKVAMSKLEEVRNRLLQLEEEMNKKTAKKSLENILQKLQAIMVKKEIEKKLSVKKVIEEQVRKIREEIEKVEENYIAKKKHYDEIISKYISEKKDDDLKELVLKLKEVNSRILGSNNRVNELELQENKLRQEIEKIETSLVEKRKKLQITKERARKLKKKIKSKNRRWNEVNAHLKLNKDLFLSKQKELIKLSSFLEDYTSRTNHLNKEAENTKKYIIIKENELETSISQLKALRKRKDKIKRSIREMSLKLRKEQRGISTLKAKLSRKLNELKEINKLARTKIEMMEELKKRYRDIEKLKEEVEKNINLKYGELMSLKKNKERARKLSEIIRKAGINSMGIVADLISYPVELSQEINLILEDFIEAIVIDKSEDIYLISNALEQLGISGVCLIKQSEDKPTENENNGGDILEKVEFKIPGLKESLRKMIGNAKNEHSSRDGDGFVINGNIKVEKGIFSQIGLKRRDLRKLELEMFQKTHELGALEKEKNKLLSIKILKEKRELEETEGRVEKLTRDVTEIKMKIKQETENENKIKNMVWKMKEELGKIKNEILKVNSKIDALTKEISILRKRYIKIVRNKKIFKKRVDTLNKRIKVLQYDQKIIGNSITSLESEKEEIGRSLDNIGVDLKNLINLKNKIGREALEDINILKNKKRDQLTTENEVKNILKEVETMNKQKLELEKEIDKITSEKKGDILGEINLLKVEIENLESQREKMNSIIQEKDKEIQQIDLETRILEAKLNESAENVGSFDEKVEVTEELLTFVEEEHKKIGDVNMLADMQYKAQSENYVLVVERLNKLEEEKRSIIDFINEIESKKKAAFLEALDSINEAFNKYFNLMVGGSAWLEIENREDPFKGGVNIIVHFPNKYPRPVYGCSGGEKSVASLCFIFALQHLKPAPFYLFDEIDAHLDPVNVQNYARLLQLRSKDSQYIVISLKDLIASKADKVIGVFMKNGKTKVLDAQQIIRGES